MKTYNHEWALSELKKLDPDLKFDTMIKTVAIITKLLETEQLKPIIVGGFSVEIYTDEAYSTRDIDIVTSERNRVAKILKELGFTAEGRHMVNEVLEIAIEFPDDELAGSYEKVKVINLDGQENLYVYVISPEDIIMDRLRAYLYWGEGYSKEWGMQILALYYRQIDKEYMIKVGQGSETEKESEQVAKWFKEIESLIDSYDE
jgi:hypothetical protein